MNATLIGSIGVTLLLIAFFLNVIRRLPTNSTLYIAMNLVGSMLAGVSSYLIGFVPFVVLEVAWALVAAAALVRRARNAIKTDR